VRSFIDTNLLIYIDAADEVKKQKKAIALFRELVSAGTAVISSQVLQEYANVALRKLKLPASLIQERLALYSRVEMVQVTPELISAALDLHTTHQFAFYDAMIVQAALSAGCERVLSEDMQSGRSIQGLLIENPFQLERLPAKANPSRMGSKR
jgi:predicted nucleic acid-binding protein